MNKEIKVYYRIIFTLIFVGISLFSFGQWSTVQTDNFDDFPTGFSQSGFSNQGYGAEVGGSSDKCAYDKNVGSSPTGYVSVQVTLQSGYDYRFSYKAKRANSASCGVTLKYNSSADNTGTIVSSEFTPPQKAGSEAGDTYTSDIISGDGNSYYLKIVVTTGNSSDVKLRIDGFTLERKSAVSGPEIQAQIPSGTDVACGDTYDFGTQTTGTSTDVTLTIENTGNADLNISSYPLSGSSDYSISPASTSTTISAGDTYDITVTFAPTSTGTLTAKITINNDDSDEDPCEINLTGEGIDPCTAPVDQPTALDLTSNTTTTSIDGSYTEPSPTADSYLVVYSTSNSLSDNPVDGHTYSAGDALGGGTVVGNISGTSFTASTLTSGTEYYFFIFANNNSNCSGGPVYNTTNPLTGNEITVPENPSFTAHGCITNSTIELNWTAATGNSTGYLLVVREGPNSPHSVNSLDPGTNLNEDLDYSAAATYGGTTPHSHILYKGTGTNVTVTGLSNNTDYIFKLFTYTIGSSEYIYSSGTQQSNSIGLDNVSSEGANCGDSQSSISWVNPTSSCFDEIMVVANETSGIDFSPSGDGSAYTANTVYSNPDDVVYKGTGTNVTVTGLTNGTTYYFEIFTRKGTEWSSGVEVSCTPNEVTILNTGDLAIVAINTNIDGSGADEVCFFSFKDITNGTAIDFTDNGYERVSSGKWGDTEGTIRLERNGNSIDKGTVICVQGHRHSSSDFTVIVCGSNDDANWNVSSLNGNYDYDLNVNDQIWIMQNGNWSNPSGSQNATYDGNILFGWTATGWEPAPGYDDTKGSTLYENAECFNTDVAATSNEDKVKFYTDTSVTRSQAAWIGEINSTGNWTGYSSNANYTSGGLDYSGSCIKIHIDNSLGNGAGKWQGGEDNNWFNCANWLNMQVPDETVDVTILANAENKANIDDTQEDANLYGPIAKCKNLTIENGGDSVSVVIDDANDELQVKDVLTIKSNGKLYNTGGGTISVDGNIIINDSALLDMHNVTAAGSVLNLKGNWTDNNTVDNDTLGFYETDSKVIFMGTTQQTITDATSNETFFNLKINNSNGLNLNGNDATVSGVLDLTLGDITTGSKNLIISNTATSAIINNGTTSYINGNLRRYVNSTGSYDFPVGTSSQYELANINLNSSSGITYFDSKFTNPVGTTDITSLGLTTDGTSLVTLLDYGFWTISPDAVTNVDYDITITSRGHTNGGSLANQHTIVKRHDSSVDWVSFNPPNHDNSTQSGTGNNPITAKISNLLNFSDYAIARSQENTLPIILYEFNAKPNNGIVEINWVTKTEINNDYFIVERSLDGINFSEIYRISGAGNSNTIINYNTIDNKPEKGYLYYRLKQVDYNGNYSYSKIATVKISDNINNFKPSNIVISNNFIRINTNSDEDYKVEIYNINGQVIYINNINESKEIDISNYSKGIYLLKIYSKVNVYTKKIKK